MLDKHFKDDSYDIQGKSKESSLDSANQIHVKIGNRLKIPGGGL